MVPARKRRGGFHRKAHVGVHREVHIGSDRLVHRPDHPDLAGRGVKTHLELEHPRAGRLDPLGGDVGHDAGDLGVGPALGRVHRVGVGDERRPIACRAAEQIVERPAGIPAGDVPERDLDARKRVPIGQILRIAVVEGLGRQARVTNRAVVRHRESHHRRREPLVDDAGAERAPHLPEAGYAGVRLDFHDGDGDVRDHALRVRGHAGHRHLDGGGVNGFDLHDSEASTDSPPVPAGLSLNALCR